MNKTLRFNQTPEQKVYVVSDTHWNHNPKWPVPLWQARGYKSVEESNEHQRETINKIVRPTDILIHLGDITLNCNEEQFEKFIASLNCQNIYTLWGNHNSPAWKIYQREVDFLFKNLAGGIDQGNVDLEVYPFRYKNLIFVGNYLEATIDGTYFVMSHYPIYVFNHMSKGALHLCGHSHYNLELSQADNPTSKILDVGWDGWAKPLSIDEVKTIMAKKNILAVDHHRED